MSEFDSLTTGMVMSDEIINRNTSLSVSSSEDSVGCTSASNSNCAENNTYVPGCFEGPEKTMEVIFASNIGHPDGLRALSRDQLDNLCKKARCTILSSVSNAYMDAYVLSESSLFIYKHRYIMKTCGTTTLLRCLGTLIEYADKIGLVLVWVGYNRKNLMFPDAQHWPHSNFAEEITYLNKHPKLQDRLNGSGYVLGPVTGDHWFVYVADHSNIERRISPTSSSTDLCCLGNNNITGSVTSDPLIPVMDRTINLMMFDMAPEVAEIFYQSSGLSAKEMTSKSGIDHLCPGAVIDETSFCPCGYSMNAILHEAYSTIHITPEKECSYCSFETNTPLKNYSALVRNVLSVFRPQRFVITLFGDEDVITSLQEIPLESRAILVPGHGVFTRTSSSSAKVETDHVCLMSCYKVENATPSLTAAALERHRSYSIA